MSEEAKESVPVVEAQSTDRHDPIVTGARSEGDDAAPKTSTYVRWLPGRSDTMRNERGLTRHDQKALGIEEPANDLWWNAANGHRLAKDVVMDALGRDAYDRAITADHDFAEVEI